MGDTIFMSCGKKSEVEKLLCNARNKIANELKLIDESIFSFCWVVDYPMFEIDKNTKMLRKRSGSNYRSSNINGGKNVP